MITKDLNPFIQRENVNPFFSHKASGTNYRPYEVWHDECKRNGYCHGVLLIPLDKKEQIIKLLRRIRDEHGYSYDVNIKYAQCLKSGTKIRRYIGSNLGLFSHIIQTRPKNGTPLFNRTGEDTRTKKFDPYLNIVDSFDCKFGFLKIGNLENCLDYCQNYRNKVETTYRFIIRACCHRMFDERTPIRLVKLYFDGNEHYKGDLDKYRLLRGSWRSYCEVDSNLTIDDRGIKKREDETLLIMNLVDNVVGAWTSLLNNEEDFHNVLYPLKDIHTRYCEGKIYKNRNSRWYRSVSFSEFEIINGNLIFRDLFRNNNQLDLLEYI